MGNIKYNEHSPSFGWYMWDTYTPSGEFIDNVRSEFFDNDVIEYEANSSTFGFQGGLGFDFRLTSALSFMIEGSYRNANFKNWEGSQYETEERNSKRESIEVGEISDERETNIDSFDGKLWYWEALDEDTDGWYGGFLLLEEEPKAYSDRRNIRLAEINLNGFVLRVGFRVKF